MRFEDRQKLEYHTPIMRLVRSQHPASEYKVLRLR